jgi:hypothetical protein
MKQSYRCIVCDNEFPNKETAVEHRDATGHELSVATAENE